MSETWWWHRGGKGVEKVLIGSLLVITEELDGKLAEVYLLHNSVQEEAVARARLHQEVVRVPSREPDQRTLPYNK